jgi:hypothetical protein
MHHLALSGLAAILAIVFATSVELRAADKPAAKAAQPAAKPVNRKQTLIKISTETTYLTKPLTKDGYIDYLAALNNQQREGVTVKNNAAVVFRRALGPAVILESIRADHFKMLGIDPLPEEGAYFLALGKFLESRSDGKPDAEKVSGLYNRLAKAMKTPWKAKDAPELAAWLDANRKSLDAIVGGTHRPRFYAPLISPGEEGNDKDIPMMVSVLLPWLQEYREVSRALTARAMLNLGQGNVEQARADVLACHRFSRLVGQGPTLIDALVSIALHAVACQADTTIALHGKLTAEQALKYRAEFDSLPPLPKMIDKIDVAERYMYLDSVSTIARHGPDALTKLTGTDSSAMSSLIAKLAANSLIDWNIVMTMGNKYYDRHLAAAKMEDRAQRAAAIAKLDDEMQARRGEMAPASILKSLLLDLSPRKTAGRKMGAVFLALLGPALSATLHAEERAETKRRLTSLAFSIAAFRIDNQAYPKTLADLSPKYVKQLPTDPRTGKSFVYRRIKAGYILYGLGRNGKDDDGQTFDSKPHGDDIVVRTPE